MLPRARTPRRTAWLANASEGSHSKRGAEDAEDVEDVPMSSSSSSSGSGGAGRRAGRRWRLETARRGSPGEDPPIAAASAPPRIPRAETARGRDAGRGWWRGRRWADDDDVGGRDVRDSSRARRATAARGRDAKATRVAHISAQRDTRAGVAARAVAKASIKTPRRASAPRRSSSEPSVRNRVDQSSWVTWHAIPIRAASPSPPPRPDVKARRASPRARIPLFRVA